MAVKLKKTMAFGDHNYRLMSKHSKKIFAVKKKSRLESKNYSVRLVDRKATLGIYAIYGRKKSASAKKYSSPRERVKTALSSAASRRDRTCSTAAGVLATKSQKSKRRHFPPSPRKIVKYRGVGKKSMKAAAATLSGYCSPTARNPKGKRKRFTTYNQGKMGSRRRILSKAEKRARRNLAKRKRR